MLATGSKEEHVGISEFLNKDNVGFRGTIKERFSDFIVNEIAPDGTVVRLTSRTLPEDSPLEEVEHIYSALSEEQQSLLDELQYSKLKALAADTAAKYSVDLEITELTKDQRKNIHLIVKSFPQLDSNTVLRGLKKFIVVQRKSNLKEGNNPFQWPRGKPKFLHFTCFKENVDTYEAISHLAKTCHTEEKRFGVAGTKDRRGRTAQRVSVSFIGAKQLLGATRYNRKVAVGNFAYENKEIRLGDLAGNRFELAVRNVDRTDEQLRPVLEAFKETGFINYFGMQRFGTTSIPTQEVGLALLTSNWRKAIDLIMEPREESDQVMASARQIFTQEKDAWKALEVLRRGRRDRSLEGKLLYGLTQCHPMDLVGALGNIPRGGRLMYCHAYQSYIWNRVASKRVAKFGTQVLVGDLIRTETGDVKVVEKAEDFTIHDVLLPLPGHQILYPENETAAWYQEIMAEDNFSEDKWKNSVRDYSLPGDYRPLLVKAKDVVWRTVRYDDQKQDLLLSDWDRLLVKEKKEQETVKEAPPGVEEPVETPSEPEEDLVFKGCENGKYQALIIGFSLPTCSYATMALREIMRVPTDKLSMIAASGEGQAAAQLEADGVAKTEDDDDGDDGGDHRQDDNDGGGLDADFEVKGERDEEDGDLQDRDPSEPAVKRLKTDL